MATKLLLLLFILFTTTKTFSVSSTHHFPTTTTTTKTFSIELIHRDYSPKSPFHDPTSSIYSRRNSSLQRSLRRLHHLTNISRLVQAAVTPDDGAYLMQLTIGTPPTLMLAVLDTGSDLIWSQCLPCNPCYTQDPPIFNPSSSSSSSFQTLGCNSTPCEELLDIRSCDVTSDRCTYNITYLDDSTSGGDLALENLGMVSMDRRNVSLLNIAFGRTTRLVGLSMGPLSLVSQLGDAVDYRFSYCFVRITDTESGSQMVLGEDAVLSGKSTPIIQPKSTNNTFYYVNLVEISVGEEDIGVPEGKFVPSDTGEGGLIVDSGAELIYLDGVVYRLLVSELKRVIGLEEVEHGAGEVCYKGTSKDLAEGKAVPVVTLHFDGGLDVPLELLSTFQEIVEGVVCLAVEPTNDVSIIGNLAQQNLNVGFDLKEKRVYMSPADCATF
ncbi:Aspartic proteinase CDR1 [Acorus calamus]|uniref:Aspartic proteinase CDR1 n=1 Tax=Acorus calamus TaxID=4465 RepID=A0AAV9CN15_ACOCL|nr:Aspartic proteinase CDR1 [Acorus calamus]